MNTIWQDASKQAQIQSAFMPMDLTEDVINNLVAYLFVKDVGLRRFAGEILRRIQWQPQPSQDIPYLIALQAWDEIMIKVQEDITILPTYLRDSDMEVRNGLVRIAVEIGEPAVEPLIACLRDKHYDVREAAAEGLGKLSDARAVESLKAYLKDVVDQDISITSENVFDILTQHIFGRYALFVDRILEIAAEREGVSLDVIQIEARDITKEEILEYAENNEIFPILDKEIASGKLKLD